jgi:probable F420-dependent oxidoreductase
MKYGTAMALTRMDDPVAVRDFAQQLDGAGFDFVGVGGHVLSAEPERYPGRPAQTYVGPFYDHMVLFAHLAAVTQRIHFQSAILILPELPTALVAKQAAEVQFFSNGRLELGVGISWHEAEYEAMGQNVHNRGRRMEEQIEVLRKMWTEPFPHFDGRWHKLDGVGLNKLPSPPIPVWMGSGNDDKVLRRVARLADGWMPLGDPTDLVPKIRQFFEEEKRDPSKFMLRAGVPASNEGPSAWVAAAKRLQGVGVTHINLSAPPDLTGSDALSRLTEAKNILASEIG